jgi:TPR repeat protein
VKKIALCSFDEPYKQLIRVQAVLLLCSVCACASPTLTQLRDFAEKGDRNAQLKLAKMHEAGLASFPKDDKMAAYWYGKAAEKGDPEAERKMGFICANGVGIAKDQKQAALWYSKAAESGDKDAQFELGLLYLNGIGVAQDTKLALKWLENAAEQGLVKAQLKLGDIYADRSAPSFDESKAVPWYTAAAKQGDNYATLHLGKVFLNHRCYRAAFLCFKKLADQNIAEGQLRVGLAYSRGQGAEQDHAEALKWFRLAANRGSLTAMQCIAESYLDGHGVPKNKQTALRWYKKAAEMGDNAAKEALSELDKAQKL